MRQAQHETRAAETPLPVLLHRALQLYRGDDLEAAEALYCQILDADPGNPDALHLLGLIDQRKGNLEMAERLIERSCILAPHAQAWTNLGIVRMGRGDLDGAIAASRQALTLDPQMPEARMNLLFALDLHPHVPTALLRAERKAFDVVCRPLTEAAAAHLNDPDPDRVLRVGYLGGDFRTSHSASGAFFFLTEHHPASVAVALYATAGADDPTAAPFKARADLWADVSELSNQELADVIRDDLIDILVDLSGPTKGGRPLVVAQKPAPIVVSGWGYPTGLGIEAVDYLVGDPVAMPSEHHDRYPESILTLPVLMGYRVDEDLPKLRYAPPEAKRRSRTYGYLGRAQKLNDVTLALWAEVLRADPTSRLLLKSGQFGDKAQYLRVVNALTVYGISPARVEIAGATSRTDHLAAHNRVDLLLDPLPQGGGATILDGLVMGVPSVTWPGQTAVGRIAASMQHLLGLDRYVVSSREQYVRLASLKPGVAAGCGLPDRRQVRARLLGSIVCDPVRYARAVEDGYRSIWRQWCAGQRVRT
jgi:predicted O-linked N-acetylglucosamine transferase (SPINDLY family)